MDINCVHQCYYQTDGKCSLHELPAITQTTYTAYDMDCPYYTDTFESQRHILP